MVLMIRVIAEFKRKCGAKDTKATVWLRVHGGANHTRIRINTYSSRYLQMQVNIWRLTSGAITNKGGADDTRLWC